MLHSTTFPYNVVGNDSAHFLNKVALFCDGLTYALFPRVFSFVDNCVFLAIVCCSCRAGIAKGNHFEFQSVTHFRMLTSKNGYVLVMIPQVTLGEILLRHFLRLMSQRWYVVQKTKNCTAKHKQPEEAPSAPRPMEQPDAPILELLGPPGCCIVAGENGGTIASSKNVGAISFTRSSSIPFLNDWSCRFPVVRPCRAMRTWSPLAKTVALRG